MTDPRYPIGQVKLKGQLTTAERQQAFAALAALPYQVYNAVRGLSETQLDTQYRQGGWSLRQVVHHLADSHINSYGRHKFTITEDLPTLQAYDENAWANMADARAPIGSSLLILQGIHTRLVHCLRSQPEHVFARRAMHSSSGELTLDDVVTMYAWHGAHHVAHITTLRAQMAW